MVTVLAVRLKDELVESQLTTRNLRQRVYELDLRAASDAYSSFDLDTARELLAAHKPDRDGDLDVGDWTHATLDQLTHVSDHEWPTSGIVLSVAISPDGEMVASGEEGSLLVIRQLANGDILQSIRTGQDRINSIAFAPDGSEIATGGSDGSLLRWSTMNPAQLGEPIRHSRDIHTLAYSPDGSWLASGGSDGMLRLDNQIGDTTPRLINHPDNIEHLAFSPDGIHLVTGCADGVVRCFETVTGELVWRNPRGSRHQRVGHVSYSSNGQLVAVCRNDVSQVEYLKARDGKLLTESSRLDGWSIFCDFVPEQPYVLIGTFNGTIHLEQAPDLPSEDAIPNQVVLPIPSTTALVESRRLWSVALSPDGRKVVTAGDDAQIRVTDTDLWLQHRCEYGLATPNFINAPPRIDPAGQRLATWHQATRGVTINDAATGKVVSTVPFPLEREMPFTLSNDGRLVALGIAADVEIKTAVDDQPVSRFTGHGGRVTQVSFSPDATLAVTIADDDTVRLWDVESGRQLRVISMGNVAMAACSSIDGLLAVVDHAGTIRLWDERPEAFRVFSDQRPAQSIAFSPTRRELAIADVDGWMKLFHADNGNRMWQHEQPNHDRRMSVVFSPDGNYLLEVRHGNHNVLIRDATSGRRVGDVVVAGAHSPANTVDACCFTSDGRNLAMTLNDGSVQVRRLPSLRYLGLGDGVASLDVSADRRQLAAVSQKGQLEAIDLVHRRQLWQKDVGYRAPKIQLEYIGGDRWLAGVSHGLFVKDAGTGGDVYEQSSGDGHGYSMAFSSRWAVRVAAGTSGDCAVYRFDPEKMDAPPVCIGEFSVAMRDEGVKNSSRQDTSVVTACALSPDERWLATPSQNEEIVIWPLADCLAAANSENDQPRWTIRLLDGTLRINRDPEHVDWSNSEALAVEPIVIKFPADHSKCVCFSLDGRYLAIGGGDGKVLIYDVAQRREYGVLSQGTANVRTVVFSDDCKSLFSAGEDNQIRQWDLESKRSASDSLPVESHVNDMDWLDDTRLVWAGDDGTVGVVTLPRIAERDVVVMRNALLKMSVTADDQLVLLDVDGILKRRALGSLNEGDDRIVSPKIVARKTTAMSLSPGGGRLAVAYDRKVQIASVDSGRTIGWLEQHDQTVNDIAFSPDASLVATACKDGMVRIWSLPACELVTTMPGHTDNVTAVAFSPDGLLLASGGRDRSILLWNVSEGQQRAQLRGHATAIRRLCFSPDGRTLASCADDSARLWDVETGQSLQVYSQPGPTQSVSFTADGQTIAVSCDRGPITLASTRLGTVLAHLLADRSAETSGRDIAFTKDDELRAVIDHQHNGRKLITLSPLTSQSSSPIE
ncbi:MAG: hypothetical protein R3C10_18725 [Pirellulales bacterium]